MRSWDGGGGRGEERALESRVPYMMKVRAVLSGSVAISVSVMGLDVNEH